MTIIYPHNNHLSTNFFYQLPDEPPPPDDPPPPEKEEPELNELPELHELPDPPDENEKPPIDALPLVRKSDFALLYHDVFFSVNFAIGKAMR